MLPLLAAALLLLGRGEGPRVPQDLAVTIEAADDAERTTLIQDAGDRIVDALTAQGCFRSAARVLPGEVPAGRLHLRVTVSEVEIETVYDTTLGDVTSPRSMPETADRYTTTLEFAVALSLGWTGEDGPREESSFRQAHSRRPRIPGEDAAGAMRAEAIEELARRVRKWACGIKPARLSPAR